MEMLHTFFTSSPMAALFLSLALGYWIGNIKLGNFQLGGMAGTLLVALFILSSSFPGNPAIRGEERMRQPGTGCRPAVPADRAYPNCAQ